MAKSSDMSPTVPSALCCTNRRYTHDTQNDQMASGRSAVSQLRPTALASTHTDSHANGRCCSHSQQAQGIVS